MNGKDACYLPSWNISLSAFFQCYILWQHFFMVEEICSPWRKSHHYFRSFTYIKMQDKDTWLLAGHKSSFMKIDCYKWPCPCHYIKSKMEHFWKFWHFDDDKWGLKWGGTLYVLWWSTSTDYITWFCYSYQKEDIRSIAPTYIIHYMFKQHTISETNMS